MKMSRQETKRQETERQVKGGVEVYFKKKISLPYDVKKCVLKILEAEGKKNARINIIFASDGLVRMINTEYRLKNKTTDVIAFEFSGKDCGSPGGDIFISVEMAKKNAKEFGTTVNSETARLVTHGTLHVLGHDHLNPLDEKAMFKKTEEYMNFFLKLKADSSKLTTKTRKKR